MHDRFHTHTLLLAALVTQRGAVLCVDIVPVLAGHFGLSSMEQNLATMMTANTQMIGQYAVKSIFMRVW